jgi:hypothetical protein
LRAFCLLLIATLFGCGGSDEDALTRASVEGSVLLDNQPLQAGVVRFVPIDGTPGPKTSVVVSAGRFSVDSDHGPVVGTHRIEIESTDNGGYAPDDEEALQRLEASGSLQLDIVQVPAVYNDHSTLTETVTEDGDNQYEFTLSSTGGR